MECNIPVADPRSILDVWSIVRRVSIYINNMFASLRNGELAFIQPRLALTQC